MKKKKNRGSFITFEGGEGAGKTLLIDSLEKVLLKCGLPTLKTRNPGGTPLGNKIRDLVLHTHDDPPTPRCELLLYLADRAHHVQTVLLPSLKEGKIILCDRYNDSTLAYQAAGRKLASSDIPTLCSFATHDLKPDLTLFLDLDPAIGLQRVEKIGVGHDRLESEKLDFHNAVRTAYLQLAKQEPTRIHVLDASQTPDAVLTQAMSLIDAHLTSKLGQ